MGSTLIEAMEHESRVDRLSVTKTSAEGELLRRLRFRNLSGGALKFAKEQKLPRVGFRAANQGCKRDYGAWRRRSAAAASRPMPPTRNYWPSSRSCPPAAGYDRRV